MKQLTLGPNIVLKEVVNLLSGIGDKKGVVSIRFIVLTVIHVHNHVNSKKIISNTSLTSYSISISPDSMLRSKLFMIPERNPLVRLDQEIVTK